MITLKDIGYRCKCFRLEAGYLQEDVARGTNYSKENVSSFECGRNDNARILLWYIIHGMSINELLGVNNGEY